MNPGPPRHGILVVEDTSCLRALLVEVLTQDGYTVTEASGGAQAVELLSADQAAEGFCLVLLDMMLPITDGLGVLQHLAQQELAIPVFAMSADPRSLRQARANGARDELPKPFELARLLAAVARNCSRAHPQ